MGHLVAGPWEFSHREHYVNGTSGGRPLGVFTEGALCKVTDSQGWEKGLNRRQGFARERLDFLVSYCQESDFSCSVLLRPENKPIS